ncbi:DNA-3-methyladenine glycosylase family protein [Glutamicibacter sp. AOP12-B1-11]|uniref:DNA-3-methyladenine glycosylase family protein n=1 Tax=Glutamicibacter sp. AOP12-B1-11 TaxID=3457725 RepID=UPI004034E585
MGPNREEVPSVHTAAISSTYDPRRPVNLLKSLGILRRGLGDPTIRLSATDAWLAFATPQGDATLHISKLSPAGVARFGAWGPGARWAIDFAPELLGKEDDWARFDEPDFFAALPEIVQRQRREHRDMVLPRTHRIFEHAAGAVLEQRVTGIEANHAWRWLIRHHGRPAPGPAPDGLRLFPRPEQIAALKRWDWQGARVENQRAQTLGRLAFAASRLEWWAAPELGEIKPQASGAGTLEAALLAIPGIGPWTVAETLQRSHGSPDHISVGDFHLAGFVGQMLTGRRVKDSTMLELLSPFAGQRQRLIRLLLLSGQKKQSFGPRYAPLDHRGR